MELLKNRIIEYGKIISPEILKVDSFLNHQIDPLLMDKIGDEFAKLFGSEKITKILTIESSGIAPSVLTGLKLGVPVLFAKKSIPSTLTTDTYSSRVHSFTKNRDYNIFVSSQLMQPGDRILIIDDFLAHGSASNALIDLVDQSGAELVGVGIVIEKGFQNGGEILRQRGIRLESLAVIESMSEDTIHFRN
jgi:xanthine phosphoribosyltransferase